MSKAKKIQSDNHYQKQKPKKYLKYINQKTKVEKIS